MPGKTKTGSSRAARPTANTKAPAIASPDTRRFDCSLCTAIAAPTVKPKRLQRIIAEPGAREPIFFHPTAAHSGPFEQNQMLEEGFGGFAVMILLKIRKFMSIPA